MDTLTNHRGSAHRRRMRTLLIAGVLVAGACSSSDPSPSDAFCKDLRSGATPMNIWGTVSHEYSAEEFADKAYGMASISCPEQLTSNERLRLFLATWHINPDA